MERPAFTGTKHVLENLAAWASAMAALREHLAAQSSVMLRTPESTHRAQQLTVRLKQAENRFRAVIGLPPLS